jgi:hypothetical protein
LSAKKDEALEEVFEDSVGEVLIVRELDWYSILSFVVYLGYWPNYL